MPRNPSGGRFIEPGEKRVEVGTQDNDATTSIAGANGWETVFDLSPDTDIYYKWPHGDHPQLGSDGNLRFRMQLPQEGGGSTEISDDAQIRIIAQGPEEDQAGADVLGQIFRYRRFSQANQFDEEDVVRVRFADNVEITEAAHVKVQINNTTGVGGGGNDVDLSQSGGYMTVEAYRGVER